MTPEAQRIAIAEFCQVKWSIPHYCHDGQWHSTPYTGRDIWTKEQSAWAGEPVDVIRDVWQLDDYLRDLNAMHEAEMILWGKWKLENAFGMHPTHREYLGLLKLAVKGTTAIVFADAAQRAEALLRTIGKWVAE